MKGVGSKAVAGAGAIQVAAQIVELVLWLADANPPTNVVLAMQGLASGVLAYVAVYFVPRERI